MTEDQLEQETLAWLQDVGYAHRDTLIPRLISGQLRLPGSACFETSTQ